MIRILTFLFGLLFASSATAATLTADLFASSTGCDATAGNQTDTLPAATGTGRMMVYQKIDATTNTCTLSRAGSDTIQGATSLTLTTQWQIYILQDWASAKWRLITLPVALSSAPQGYFSGLKLTMASASTVSVAAGTVTDSAGLVMLAPTSTCTASLNTSGNQGIDVGSKAASTWYAVFVIRNPSTGAISCLLAATTAAAVPTPTVPSPFVAYAYVGRFKTDGSSDVNGLTLLPRGQFYIDASDTYTPGASGFRPRTVRLLACGGAGGGGSGGRQVSGTAVSGGAGGSGGGCGDATYPYDQLAALSVTVGAGGAATTAPGTDNTAGVAGNTGNPTFFGASATTAYAYGGAGCAGDGARLNAAAASGGSGAGTTNTAGAYQVCSNGAAGTGGNAMIGGTAGVATSTTPTTTATSYAGSAGGSSSTSASASGGSSGGRLACSGGGAGGTVTSAPASVNGGAGGYAADSGVSRGAGGTTGSHDGGVGNLSTLSPSAPGTAGGGGYGNSAGAAGNGGLGMQCSGGGGGGSALNGSAAGNGGKGGDGYAFVWEAQ